MPDEWHCPNCGLNQTFGLLEKRVCERCGYSDEPPPDNEDYGYD